MRHQCFVSRRSLSTVLLLVTLGACHDADGPGVVDPLPVPAPKAALVPLALHGPTWLVSGAPAAFWSSFSQNVPQGFNPSGWSWASSDADVLSFGFVASWAVVQAGVTGTAWLSASGFLSDTARKLVTVLPRPTETTPIEQAPITASSFRLLQLNTGQSDVYFTPLVDVAARLAGDPVILEATIDLPGVPLTLNRCSTNRRVGRGGPLFGESYGDQELWLQADSTAHATGNPVLHLIVLDAVGRATRISLPGTVMPFDATLMPPSRYLGVDDGWSCGSAP